MTKYNAPEFIDPLCRDFHKKILEESNKLESLPEQLAAVMACVCTLSGIAIMNISKNIEGKHDKNNAIFITNNFIELLKNAISDEDVWK